MMGSRISSFLSTYLRLIFGIVRLTFKSNRRLISNNLNVIKDENFYGSIIIIKYDYENLLYAEFPGVGRKFKNGEMLLNSGNMNFPYIVKFQGFNSREILEIDFIPQNILKINNLEMLENGVIQYKRKKIIRQRFNLTFRKTAINYKYQITLKTNKIKFTSPETKIDLKPFNKNSNL